MTLFKPDYNIYFDSSDVESALNCMNEYGYCVIKHMMPSSWIEELKREIDVVLDPSDNLPDASNRYHMMFAEESDVVWRLLDHSPYLNFLRSIHGTDSLCLHRSAAILRSPGEGMGNWHKDHRGHIKHPKTANDILNRLSIPSGCWFYLNGSHPDRSGIAVIEKSHYIDWPGPEGYQFTAEGSGFRRVEAEEDVSCNWMDVPGCIAVEADPGDLICFAALTFHANMATHERRYSCGFGFRSKEDKMVAPWKMPTTAKALIKRLGPRYKNYLEGYTGYDGDWGPTAM
ncbi:MAG: phytanoyl-CoA dioxygenase family protein [Candidatus Latescibacterota bacterium]|nr:phytanoyl-CoA dioxygenase family protein [Candidatus Latescibacterota bacterium]